MTIHRVFFSLLLSLTQTNGDSWSVFTNQRLSFTWTHEYSWRDFFFSQSLTLTHYYSWGVFSQWIWHGLMNIRWNFFLASDCLWHSFLSYSIFMSWWRTSCHMTCFSYSRHCGRLLCSKCSSKDMPIIKFNQSKPQRVCDVCFDVLSYGGQL